MFEVKALARNQSRNGETHFTAARPPTATGPGARLPPWRGIWVCRRLMKGIQGYKQWRPYLGVKILFKQEKSQPLVVVGANGPTSQTCEKNPTVRDWFYSQLSAAVDFYPSRSLFYLAGISIPSWEQAKLDKNASPHGSPASRLTTTELYEIDSVLGRIKQRRTVTHAHAYHVPEISTDHRMVVATICLPQKVWFSMDPTHPHGRRRSEQGRKILGTEQRSKRTQTYFTDNPQVAQMSKQQKDLRRHIQQERDSDPCYTGQSLKPHCAEKKSATRARELHAQAAKIEVIKDDNARTFAAIKDLRFSGGDPLAVRPSSGETLVKPLDHSNIISKRFESLFKFNIDAAPLPPFQAAPLRKPVKASEVARAASRLKNGRSFGAEGVAKELLKYCSSQSDDPMAITIANIIIGMFSKGEVIKAMGQGVLFPLQKPGKPRGPCSSLHPIILLNGIRKLFSLIVLECCKPQVDLYLPRSQSSYRRGHSTTDIVFTKRISTDLVMTNVWDLHIHPILGIDLSRAFDTVDRAQLISVLKDVVDDDDIVRMVHALLTDTTLAVRVRGEVAPPFEAVVGSPQGDSLSPQLFNIYYEAALRDLCKTYPPTPVEDNSTPETQYADDLDFISTSHQHLENIHEQAINILPEWKLQANASKTERIHICWKSEREEETWRKTNCGSWGLTEQLARKIDVWHRKQLRRLAGYFHPHHISNTKLYKICNSCPLQNDVHHRRWTLSGHILRKPPDSPAQKALNIAFSKKLSSRN
ncbi:hypothetical protein Bbelb_070970 [Branchiostoma belcheri]|nr:hypothetical protein Bbelb_070970 [Branchiostoma belcheri]